jgi:hypothetical protein
VVSFHDMEDLFHAVETYIATMKIQNCLSGPLLPPTSLKRVKCAQASPPNSQSL